MRVWHVCQCLSLTSTPVLDITPVPRGNGNWNSSYCFRLDESLKYGACFSAKRPTQDWYCSEITNHSRNPEALSSGMKIHCVRSAWFTLYSNCEQRRRSQYRYFGNVDRSGHSMLLGSSGSLSKNSWSLVSCSGSLGRALRRKPAF